ncbi:MAG: ribosome hibernation-promoting factor, HPF/YfiA family [Solirubrobacteraceae bacterium]
MRIAVKGRNTDVSAQLREHIQRRFRRISRQVSALAELEVELRQERNPAIPDSQVAEATLHLKGVTLRACDASPDMLRSVNLCADDLARQVKRHRDKRRKRRPARTSQVPVTGTELGPGPPSGGDVRPAA